ncbi:HAMP domain-containing sensor histidine kinase [Paenibacillus sp. KS-LC4]|uniref:sensor histidine kinase n=1 Tax=Paenibacillus sp. KS-LC4 TaxID=2979727 RepID=UPI0030D31208
MRISLKLRMSIVLVVLLALTVSVLSMMVQSGIERDQQERTEKLLAKQSEVAAQYVRQSFATSEPRLAREAFMPLRGQRLALYISMISGMQTTLYDTQGEEAGSSIPIGGEKGTNLSDTLQYALNGKIAYQTAGDSLIYFAPLQGEDGLLGVVSFHYSLKNDHQFAQTIRELFQTAGIIAVVAGAAMGYGYFYRLAAVISRLRSAAGSIREGRYLQQIPVRRRDELGDLSQDIFFMSSAIERHIEEMKEEQRKLTLAILKLQQLEQQQKQFIGNISHEFKTPLTSIRAYVDLLDMYRDDPRLIDEAIQSMGKESGRLYDLVEKVLHLAALEKYEFEQQAEVLKLDELLLDLCTRMQGKAAKFDLMLHTQLEPALIWADRESLMQIFINLIDNAIKYNRPGGQIVVALHVDGNRANVVVRDTGIGIPAEAHDKIFEPFYTVNRDRSRISGGTGLGLSLVKQLAEAQQGELVLVRSSEEGTTFKVFFPLYNG